VQSHRYWKRNSQHHRANPNRPTCEIRGERKFLDLLIRWHYDPARRGHHLNLKFLVLQFDLALFQKCLPEGDQGGDG
jgi:hypothetical protein